MAPADQERAAAAGPAERAAGRDGTRRAGLPHVQRRLLKGWFWVLFRKDLAGRFQEQINPPRARQRQPRAQRCGGDRRLQPPGPAWSPRPLRGLLGWSEATEPQGPLLPLATVLVDLPGGAEHHQPRAALAPSSSSRLPGGEVKHSRGTGNSGVLGGALQLLHLLRGLQLLWGKETIWLSFPQVDFRACSQSGPRWVGTSAHLQLAALLHRVAPNAVERLPKTAGEKRLLILFFWQSFYSR